MSARRAALLACALSLLAAACTGGPRESARSPSPGSSRTAATPAAGPPLGPRSRLCEYPRPKESPPPTAAAPLPAPVRAVADEVTAVRHESWAQPVVPEAVSQERLGQILRDLVERSLPAAQLARETRAWITIGALPPGASLRTALLAYVGTEVVGFYDTLSHRLVYAGSSNPSPYQRYVLSHELTHALDDQRFDLSRADALQYACRDERLSAFVALMEGDAVYTSGLWAQRYLSGSELDRLRQEAAGFPPPPATVPPFVQALQQFPYPNGLAFVRALVARGGEAAVNAAVRNPPVSTEQILHPDRYPSDVPAPVTVDRPGGLGPGWRLIDREGVGEAWLKLLLQLRLPEGEAAQAADGWGGARYEAWARGASTVVVLRTVWDGPRDASEFAAALRSFVETRPATVDLGGSTVTATFGSDAASLVAAGA